MPYIGNRNGSCTVHQNGALPCTKMVHYCHLTVTSLSFHSHFTVTSLSPHCHLTVTSQSPHCHFTVLHYGGLIILHPTVIINCSKKTTSFSHCCYSLFTIHCVWYSVYSIMVLKNGWILVTTVQVILDCIVRSIVGITEADGGVHCMVHCMVHFHGALYGALYGAVHTALPWCTVWCTSMVHCMVHHRGHPVGVPHHPNMRKYQP